MTRLVTLVDTVEAGGKLMIMIVPRCEAMIIRSLLMTFDTSIYELYTYLVLFDAAGMHAIVLCIYL
jgi:hypothetical protein